MMTEEGKVKKDIMNILSTYDIQPAAKAGAFEKAAGWYFSAVQGPMSVRGIPDFIGHYRGVFWGIEAKAPKKKPTGFQALQISAIEKSGGAVFVVDGPESLEVFEGWLIKIGRLADRRIHIKEIGR